MRSGSVTAAAQELGLTQSTVSRLIQTLEAQLGQELFVRVRKRLIPTDAATRYFHDISNALDLIQRGSMMLIANPEGGSLDLAVLPTFATRWLAPRLPEFLSQHPGISINLSTRFERFNFSREQFDAVIYFGDADWPDSEHLKLFDERLTACASPELLRRTPITSPDDLKHLVLLQLPTRPHAWSDWFLGQGAKPESVQGMMMDQFSMMIQVAISGTGIALLPDYLARIEIDEGRLRPILQQSIPSRGSYWLAWPQRHGAYKPLMALSSWIASLQP